MVAETQLSEVDGAAGRLEIAGQPLEELSGHISFEALCQRMWRVGAGVHCGQPARPRSGAQRDLTVTLERLGTARVAAHRQVLKLGNALGKPDGMDALRAAIAHGVPTGDDFETALQLTASMAVFAAHSARKRQGLALVEPDPSAGHASDYLRMLRGERPSPAAAGALESYWVAVVDHGMNASTFAARVVTSTGSDPVSAITAALGALKGPLHGGAPGPVLDMLHAIGDPEQARGWLEAELAAGGRIMGMGHRIYRVRDPRAAALEQALAKLNASLALEATSPPGVSADPFNAARQDSPGRPQHPPGAAHKLTLARAVEAEATRLLSERYPNRALRANVEFYTAVLLDALGIDQRAFTPTFAAGRVVGWCAHVMEQKRSGRLIRPASRYRKPSL